MIAALINAVIVIPPTYWLGWRAGKATGVAESENSAQRWGRILADAQAEQDRRDRATERTQMLMDLGAMWRAGEIDLRDGAA